MYSHTRVPQPFRQPFYSSGSHPYNQNSVRQPYGNYHPQGWHAQPYYGQNYLPYQMQQGQPSYNPHQGNAYNQPYTSKKNKSESIFQNPLQPMEQMYTDNQSQGNAFPYMHPYPKQSFMTKPPSGMQSVMNSFKSQDGSIDFNKMVNTAGQMMNAVNQVSSMVKGLGGFFKA